LNTGPPGVVTLVAEPSYTSGISSTTGRRWTYRQLADEVDAVALGLLDLGVVKGLPFRRLKSDGSAPGSTTITWRFKEPMCT